MSYIAVIGCSPGTTERATVIGNLPNGWKFSFHAWEVIGARYIEGLTGVSMLVSEANAKKVWALSTDPNIPSYVRTVIAMTFDRWYVKRVDYAQAAKDIRKTIVLTGLAGTWPQMADIFEQLAASEILANTPTPPAIGWYNAMIDNFFEETDENNRIIPTDWSEFHDVYADR